MTQPPSLQTLDNETLAILRCPVTGSKLRLEGETLISEVGGLTYAIRNGIPVLMAEEAKLPEGINSLEELKEKYKDQIRR